MMIMAIVSNTERMIIRMEAVVYKGLISNTDVSTK